MADNALTKLSSPAQIGIAAVLGIAMCATFYFTWWSPATKEEIKKSEALKKLQQEIQALEVTANKLPEFQREVQLLEASLEKLKLILPTERQMPDLMKRIQSLVLQSTLSLRNFTPGSPISKEFYQELPIAVELTGSYHNAGAFFDRVGRLIRLVSIGNVQMKTNTKQTATNTVVMTLTATTYMYVDAPPPAPKGGKAPPKRPAPPAKK